MANGEGSSVKIAFDLRRAALVLVDLQRDLLDGEGFFARRNALEATEKEIAGLAGNCRKLADAMRRAGRPVVFVKTEFRADHIDAALAPGWKRLGMVAGSGVLVAGTRGAAWLDGLEPAAADPIVIKKGHSAFQDTPLDRVLTELGCDQIVLAGSNLLDAINGTFIKGAALGYDIFPIREALLPSSAYEVFANRAEEDISLAMLESLPRPGPLPPGEARSVLLIIDMQKDFVGPDSGRLPVSTGDPEVRRKTEPVIIENNQRLAQAFRERGWPVIFMVTSSRLDMSDSALTKAYASFVRAGWLTEGPGLEIVNGLTVGPDDFVLQKKASSSFSFTPLHRVLRNLGIRRIVVSGGAATGCVGKTTREGAGLGYEVTVVADAVYPAGSSHLPQVLAKYAGICDTEAVLESLGQQALYSGMSRMDSNV